MGPLPQKQPIEPDRPDDAGARPPSERDHDAVERRPHELDDAGVAEPDEASDKVGGTAHRRAR